MSETRKLVKSVLGFILSILVIVGGLYGLNVKVEVQDTTAPTSTEEVITPEETPSITDEVVETEQSPAESTQTEDEVPSVDESVDTDVTESADNTEDVVTEKGEK